jgi:hypothetical protein
MTAEASDAFIKVYYRFPGNHINSLRRTAAGTHSIGTIILIQLKNGFYNRVANLKNDVHC